jgi:hypothetical protein
VPATASRASGGPLTHAAQHVLRALLWQFHNARDGRCFPSYERLAEAAGVARSTVAEAIKALEFAGVLTWKNRITRIRERCRDLFGREGWRWRVIRTSNTYVFRDPKAAVSAGFPIGWKKCRWTFRSRRVARRGRITSPGRVPTPLSRWTGIALDAL